MGARLRPPNDQIDERASSSAAQIRFTFTGDHARNNEIKRPMSTRQGFLACLPPVQTQ